MTLRGLQISKLGRLGLLGITADCRFGGSGGSTLGLAIAVEEISRGCGGTGAIVSIHNALYVSLLDTFGTEQQKEQFLSGFTTANLGCFALSESGNDNNHCWAESTDWVPWLEAGSDVSAISTTAQLNGDFYVLSGRKTWVTSGNEGKAAVVFATVDRTLKHKGNWCSLEWRTEM